MKSRFCSVRSLLGSERGSSTVLIILILLSLTVFSVLSIASAMSDHSLARKNASWIKAYYDTESKAERFLGALSEKLAAAERAAVSAPEDYAERAYFLHAKRELEQAVPNLPEDTRPSSFELYPSSDFEAPDFLSSDEVPSLYLTANIENRIIGEKGAETVQNIAISLEIILEHNTYMRIDGWREWQPEFDYGENGENIWTGE